MKTFLLLIATASLISACSDMPVKEIESHSYKGYYKNEAGQDLSVSDCNQKMMKEVSSGKKSESETMMKNINEDLKKKNGP
jgi:hypothetical protein